MERLNFGVDSKYIAVEAAVHLARYTTVRNLCAGKSVLDASCGEGYGTALLARWGARRAVGVDISSSAIESARKNFKDSGATYVCASGEELPAALGDAKFDLIVSLETVEHVDDPAAQLESPPSEGRGLCGPMAVRIDLRQQRLRHREVRVEIDGPLQVRNRLVAGNRPALTERE